MKTLRFAIFTLLTGLLFFSQATAEILITEITIEGGIINIVFEDPDGISYQVALQNSLGLTQESWANLPGAAFNSIDATHYRFTLPMADANTEFFRIIGTFLGTTLDPDGDGLPEDLEVILNTNPEIFDTDEDGFSDGAEFAYGTDPVDPLSKPVYINLPTVDFALPHSTTREGSAPHQIQVFFDQSFNGTVNYAVNSLSNVTAGVDFTLGGDPEATTGSIAVDGTSAFIPLTIVDDAKVSGQRVVIINLRLDGENYFIGGRASHAVLLEDNDAWWTGTLFSASGEASGRIFRLKIARENSSTTAVFGAGAGLDGLPVPEVVAGGGAPPIETTSISSTLIPVGQWPGTVNADTPIRFSVDSPALSVPAGSLFGTEMIKRRLQLNAQLSLDAPGNPHQLDEIKTIGDYTETLSNSAGTTLAVFPGSFLLVRDIPAPLPVLSNLVPTAP